MSPVQRAFFVLTFAVWSSEVTSWIVDMAAMEKSLGVDEHPDYDEVNSSVASEDDEVSYTSNYAENFEYRTFRKKEVDSIIKNGSKYLEGLSGALAAYRAVLENCSRSAAKTEEHKPEELRTCKSAEQKKLVVQTLSQMALTATDKLRDKAFENNNQGEGDEEKDLIQLAWSLDRLATLTASEPARDLHAATHSPDNSPKLTTEAPANVAKEDEQQNLEILEQVENGRPLTSFPPTLTEVKSVQKRDLGDVMKYYVKYKVWNNSNPIDDTSSNYNQFDVNNSFKVLPIRKRSITDKKAVNMRSVIQTKGLKNQKEVKEQSKNKSKLVKFIKVYRRKISKNPAGISFPLQF
ncbi:uncharacterized protein LOC123878366 [Maniola jurtina]|uniref:uncharacterized protein LOC123878366 n=1 Tax=Maniola jurtina TaxID=191418 RepID=UPI001E68B733|nr:uncharacterized protein LOC123878366 [Maniola jurtina]